MRKTVLIPLSIVVIGMFAAAGASWAAAKKTGESVRVKLSAVPSVKTLAKGEADFKLDKDGDAIHYRLNLSNIENVTMGHIHLVGDDKTPSAIVVWLYPTKGEAPALREGKFKGTIAKGDIYADNLTGPLKGKTVKELYEMLESGKAGVAVHTKQNGGGELWGFNTVKGHMMMKGHEQGKM